MRYITFIYVSFILLTSCNRNNNFIANDGVRLKSITSDSAGTLQFAYSNDTITSVSGGENANIQYISIGDTPCVSISYSDGEMIKYYLNLFKLPIKIVFYNTSGVANADYGVDFIYQKGTFLLDSAILRESGYKLIFNVVYSGNNISQIQESYVSTTQNTVVAIFDYTYSSENNIFRKTDSLLYVYSYIQPAVDRQAMVTATYFAETFSASTFSGIKVSGITSDYVFPDNQTSTMTPSLNNGKIVKEFFSDPVFEGLAGKRYNYQP
jgi:hypothetical protein